MYWEWKWIKHLILVLNIQGNFKIRSKFSHKPNRRTLNKKKDPSPHLFLRTLNLILWTSYRIWELRLLWILIENRMFHSAEQMQAACQCIIKISPKTYQTISIVCVWKAKGILYIEKHSLFLLFWVYYEQKSCFVWNVLHYTQRRH